MFETLIIIFFLFYIYIFKLYKSNDVIYILLDNKNKYLVRNLPDKKEAAETLDKIKKNLNDLVDHILNDYNDKINKESLKDIKKEYIDYVKIIKDKLKTVKIRESTNDNSFTSYSVNKGEEMVFCIRSKKDNKIHDINELMYVAIHEIAHIGCPEIGHTELFRKINYYLLDYGKNKKIYNYRDYNERPTEYCGLTLNNNLLNK